MAVRAAALVSGFRRTVRSGGNASDRRCNTSSVFHAALFNPRPISSLPAPPRLVGRDSPPRGPQIILGDVSVHRRPFVALVAVFPRRSRPQPSTKSLMSFIGGGLEW